MSNNTEKKVTVNNLESPHKQCVYTWHLSLLQHTKYEAKKIHDRIRNVPIRARALFYIEMVISIRLVDCVARGFESARLSC